MKTSTEHESFSCVHLVLSLIQKKLVQYTIKNKQYLATAETKKKHPCKHELIGLRETLQENPIWIMGKSMVSCHFFPSTHPSPEREIWVVAADLGGTWPNHSSCLLNPWMPWIFANYCWKKKHRPWQIGFGRFFLNHWSTKKLCIVQGLCESIRDYWRVTI